MHREHSRRAAGADIQIGSEQPEHEPPAPPGYGSTMDIVLQLMQPRSNVAVASFLTEHRCNEAHKYRTAWFDPCATGDLMLSYEVTLEQEDNGVLCTVYFRTPMIYTECVTVLQRCEVNYPSHIAIQLLMPAVQ